MTPKMAFIPARFRVAGFILTLSGLLVAWLRFVRGIKPAFLELKMLALHSLYFENRYFTVIRNNVSEEIAGLLILTGLIILSFSRLSHENELTASMRFKSFLYAIIGQIALSALALLFLYGISFAGFAIINIFLLLLLQNVVFWIWMIKDQIRHGAGSS